MFFNLIRTLVQVKRCWLGFNLERNAERRADNL